MTAEKEEGGLKGLADKAQDAVGGMVGMASAATAGAHDGEAFVANACTGDLYEVEAARIALDRARSDSVRGFAEMMVAHHTTAVHQMKSALRSSEVTSQFKALAPATALDERRQGMLQHLREAAEGDFDKAYLDQQKLAHQEALTLHQGYADHGDNPQLRALAAGGAPMIQRHLRALSRVGVH
jgi:putative membrane protein